MPLIQANNGTIQIPADFFKDIDIDSIFETWNEHNCCDKSPKDTFPPYGNILRDANAKSRTMTSTDQWVRLIIAISSDSQRTRCSNVAATYYDKHQSSTDF